MIDDFNPTFRPPSIGYRGPTSSRVQNQAWQDILFDQQRMLDLLGDLQLSQRDYAHVFALEQEGIRQRIQALQMMSVEPESVDPLYGKKLKVRFSDPSILLSHTGGVYGDHRMVSLSAINRTSKLTTRSLGGQLYFPTNALQAQYIDQDGNVIEPQADWDVYETSSNLAIDGDPKSYHFRRVSVPATSNVTGLGLRMVVSVDDNLHHRSCNLLELIPFPEFLTQVRQVTMLTGSWGGIPLASDLGSANLEHRPLFAQAGYRNNYHATGDQTLSSSRQIYAFPNQDVVSAEIDLWQAQGVLEGDRRVFTLGCNNIFLGLASFANTATFRLSIPRPAGGWSKIMRLDPAITVDGQPPFSLPNILETRMSYARPDALLGFVSLGEAIPNPEELTVDLTLQMDPIVKAPPLLFGFDLSYLP